MGKTITQIRAGSPGYIPLGTELIEGVQDAASVAFTVAEVRGNGVLEVATGAVPVDVEGTAKVVQIVHSGSETTEFINLLPPADLENSAGTMLVFSATFANAADRVEFTQENLDGTFYPIYATDPGNAGYVEINELSLNGSFGPTTICVVAFVWCGLANGWKYIPHMSFNLSAQMEVIDAYIWSAQDMFLDARDIAITPTRRLILNNLPTVNPVVAGAVWNDAGTLKISAG